MKRLIVSLTSLAIVLVLAFVFIVPLWDSLVLLENNLSSKERELEYLEARVEKVNHLKKEYQNLESEIQKIFLALPAEEDIPNLLVQFEALASNSGLILDAISFGQLAQESLKTGMKRTNDAIENMPKESSLRNLSVSMNLAGRYIDFKNYLDSLARNIRSMSVESISFSSKNENIDTFTFDLTVNVYYQ